MAFREIKDIKKTADYQRNLRAALTAAIDQKAEFVVWQGFPFAEQTAQMVVVAPAVDNGLIRKVAEQGAHKLGFGECRVAGKKLLVKPGNSVGANQISLAFKVAKIAVDVEVVGRDVDLSVLEATQPALREQTQAHGAPVANAAMEIARNAVAGTYPALIARLEQAVTETRDMNERTVLTQLQRKIGGEWEDRDYVAVQSMIKSVEKAVAAVEARIKERDKEKGEFESVLAGIERRFDDAQARVPADDFKQVMKAWGAAAHFAAKDQYSEAGKLLAAIPGAIDKAEDAGRVTWRERVKVERERANAQLPSPDKGETELLDQKVSAALQHVASLDVANFESAFAGLEAAVRQLSDLRRLRELAAAMSKEAEAIWFGEQARVSAKGLAKVQGSYGNVKKWFEESKTHTEVPKIAQALKNVVKSAQELKKLVEEDLKGQNIASEKIAKANAAFAAALDKSKNEDAEAEQYGNDQFGSGLLNSIWKQVLKVRSDNPPNGSIVGIKTLADVESAIDDWGSTADSGVLTNFHVPGGDGGRPQAKWEKNFVRAEIQANFCAYWRGNKVNIHVDVDPKSYFDKYGGEVDWALVPESIRKQLGRG